MKKINIGVLPRQSQNSVAATNRKRLTQEVKADCYAFNSCLRIIDVRYSSISQQVMEMNSEDGSLCFLPRVLLPANDLEGVKAA